MKTYNQYINESVRDKMTPKSKEDVLKHFCSLNKDEMEETIYDDCIEFFDGDQDKLFKFVKTKVGVSNLWKKMKELHKDYKDEDVMVVDALTVMTKEELIKMFTMMINNVSNESVNQYINESVRDKMTPKSEEDIKKSLKSLGPYDKMYKAIEFGILSIVKEIIEDGIDLTKNAGGGTPVGDSFVDNAVRYGKLDILEYLLNNGCDLDDSEDYFLNLAVVEGHYDVAQFFVEKGATLHEDYGEYHLQLAVEHNNLKLVKLVLDCGEDAFEDDWFNDIILSDNTNPEIIKLMMKESSTAKEFVEKMYDDYKKGVKILEKYV